MKLIAAAVLLGMAFASSLVFYGTAANLVVLALVAALLLASVSFIGTTGFRELAACNGGGLLLALAVLGYLVVAYRFSVSPDNSFAPSWALASVPLCFLSASAIAADARARRVLIALIGLLVFVLAIFSDVRFVALGERAHEPLLDPNNYATLTYLVWIPLVHGHLVRNWRDGPSSPIESLIVLTSSFFLVLAVLATHSRTALLIVGGSLLFWIVLSVVGRRSSKMILLHALVALCAWIVAAIVIDLNAAPTKGFEFESGLLVRRDLIQAALSMFSNHPLGIGVFCFSLMYPGVRSTEEQDTAGLFVHNDYIQFLTEGGVPLLAFLIVFVILVGRQTQRYLRLDVSNPAFAQVGYGLALIAAFAHALANFVFYSLPLDIVIGVMAALLFQALPQQRRPSGASIPSGATVAVLAMGWIMWLYLVLDVAIAGVFQGQPTFGLANATRADPNRMLEFARTAQSLNVNRGIPVYAEAVLLYREAQAEPDSRYLPESAYERFHAALSVDPWNTMIYVRFTQFLDEFSKRGRAPGETDEELLLSALALDPTFTPAIDELLGHYVQSQENAKAFALLRDFVYPWMRTIRKNDAAASDRYLDMVAQYAEASDDQALLSEVTERKKELAHIEPRRPHMWFF